MTKYRFKNKVQDYRCFRESIDRCADKIQIGARGKKNGPDWRVIDLYDQSPLVDLHWDVHRLPVEDEVFDCIECNAVLEHVQDPALAVYEFWRTLRPGGSLWVEVPFLQFYHAHPSDFYRWTVSGICLLLEDFEIVSHGISVGIGHEVQKVGDYLSRRLPGDLSKAAIDEFERTLERYHNVKDPRMYSMVYAWGRKKGTMPVEKERYMEYRKLCLENKY